MNDQLAEAVVDLLRKAAKVPMTVSDIVGALEATTPAQLRSAEGRDGDAGCFAEDVRRVLRTLKFSVDDPEGDGTRRRVFRHFAGMWCFAPRQEEALTNLLITPEYRDLGMEIFVGRYRYIPLHVEHRFFEYRASTITGAGLGLFVRRNRHIRCGTLALEYFGEFFSTVPAGKKTWLPYMIRLRAGGFINGVDVMGRLLSRAPFINDAGPQLQNVELRELDGAPGRVFVVALRDLMPGEELFATYGAAYWGMGDYEELATRGARRETASNNTNKGSGKNSGARVRARTPSNEAEPVPDAGTLCRSCRARVPRRAALLHAAECGDPKNTSAIRRLNSLPFNAATAIDHASRESWSTQNGRARSAVLVDARKPLTEYNTHAEVEFTPPSRHDDSP